LLQHLYSLVRIKAVVDWNRKREDRLACHRHPTDPTKRTKENTQTTFGREQPSRSTLQPRKRSCSGGPGIVFFSKDHVKVSFNPRRDDERRSQTPGLSVRNSWDLSPKAHEEESPTADQTPERPHPEEPKPPLH